MKTYPGTLFLNKSSLSVPIFIILTSSQLPFGVLYQLRGGIKILAMNTAKIPPIGIETTPANQPDVTKTKLIANKFIQPINVLKGVPDPNLAVTSMCPKKQMPTIVVKKTPHPVQHKKRL